MKKATPNSWTAVSFPFILCVYFSFGSFNRIYIHFVSILFIHFYSCSFASNHFISIFSLCCRLFCSIRILFRGQSLYESEGWVYSVPRLHSSMNLQQITSPTIAIYLFMSSNIHGMPLYNRDMRHVCLDISLSVRIRISRSSF